MTRQEFAELAAESIGTALSVATAVTVPLMALCIYLSH